MANKKKESKTFEISLIEKTPNGKSSRRKSFSSDSSYKVWEFWNKHQIRKNKKRKDGGATSKNEAEKILKDLNKD